MKKSTFLLFTLGMILHAAFSQAFAYDNLYVIGDGCAAAWNQSEAIEMTNAGNDIFTWRGSLIGNGRFKFLLARNTWDALSCEFETNTENIVISPDIETDIYERPNVAGNNDVCFKVSETAVYDIVINTATMKIIVTKNTTDPDLHQLYLAGGATPCEWNIGSFIKMTKLSEGEFFWYGNLSGGDGHIQFLSLQKWEIRIGPATNQTVFTSGAEYNLQRVDNRFIANASNSGLYEVYINLKTMKAKFTKAPDLSQLYMVGDATSVQWTPSGNAPLTKIANGV
ncbi:MAG: SusF/SusE family outer membrane protein, partial [Dysgonamonadaceae bacterium]|nr:SusF/SusE family outer membrane protein [Dysgonamonadaceae bacterium]